MIFLHSCALKSGMKRIYQYAPYISIITISYLMLTNVNNRNLKLTLNTHKVLMEVTCIVGEETMESIETAGE